MDKKEANPIDEIKEFFAKDPVCKLSWGVPSQVEHRWPATAAVLGVITIYFGLPARYIAGPNWLMPALELAIILPLTLSAPKRVANEGRIKQFAATAAIGIVMIANMISLVLLVNTLLYSPAKIDGAELFFSSFEIWITNVIIFALWYWELDRGGPDDRTHVNHRAPDFLFPQMNTPGCASASWTPSFIDYLYLAFTNATAFSPTDVLPLTAPAKVLMLFQSIISLVTVTLVAARAVNILH